MTRTIRYGDEYYTLHENGIIERRDGFPPSGQWRVTGAATFNNFGYEVKRYTLEQILTAPESVPWKHKNGKQRTHIIDYDHGSQRLWASPDHTVY